MPAADPKAKIPKTITPAFENCPLCTSTPFPAPPVDALAVAFPLELALLLKLAVPLAMLDVDVCPAELLLLSVSFFPSRSLQTTTPTLLLKHSPTRFNAFSSPPSIWHTAVHGSGIPNTPISPPVQHSYRSQKAWSVTAASLLMTQPGLAAVGRSTG
ncbi:hypothetical protein PTNB73_09612 [Pyrenophora teres f. teres]|uniref:Uncharacterized protein n=1 Tax=Pyrenophora teres f. teres (strain 0-1) TaxID=861557 RepID=E3RLB5_PYRTT|nr:hypothetical protein PTT_09141 [Pyrenophora teres f. teres 0-1]KAE8822868.1 hypothetical protein HRS9139_10208 [Pyrenophora teres f. teres]KAE8826004.1 hypothetical protein PTNB85_08949 [Pyrenophora teres f. teres]KAE8832987.1 hypothetical protein HRS9122_08700 [Pyrenophora teres f. teres]KAE8852937.1 hypothetical protein PTNB29_10327 [Pyrenophora teres f. teres]